MINGPHLLNFSLLKRKKTSYFWKKRPAAMKNGLFITMWSEKVLTKSKWLTVNDSENWSTLEDSHVVHVVNLKVYCKVFSLNLDKYWPRLNRLMVTIDVSRLELASQKCVIVHQDNTRPLFPLQNRLKLVHLCWNVLLHPPYFEI